MCIKENRNRMWTFIFLYILGLNISQATAEGNSTQMYYTKLTIDKSAIGNITEILKPFVNDTSLHVDDLKITTKCTNDSAGKKCSCTPGYRWSDDVCQSSQRCCNNTECTFQKNPPQMCVFGNAVTITGFVILEGQKYQGCLTVDTSDEYKDCRDNLLIEMKKVYSTLSGFDTLTITRFRLGSIIVEFTMTIASGISSKDLAEKSEKLSNSLLGPAKGSVKASLDMETTGVVRLIMPTNPVCYHTSTSLTCKSQEDLGTQGEWRLKNLNGENDITSGSISNVTRLGPKETKVTLTNVTELWAGEYICVYEQKSGLNTISHKASARMDVSLLPDIDVFTEPGFPRCEKSSDLLNVKTICEIKKSSEDYSVTWKGDGITTNSSYDGDVTKGFTADKIVGCNPSSPATGLQCVFKNRCKQEREASVPINIIYEGEKFCPAEGDWGEAKAGFPAVLKCTNAAGVRRRQCNSEGIWEDEESGCVNLDLDSVLQSATIANTGLGSLDENAARVFSRLENITNNTENINSFANMRASVDVLSILSVKISNVDNKATDDLLESSSNILDKSLENSWQTTATASNSSLAEQYLSTVEHLFAIANITGASGKKNIKVDTCDSKTSKCSNSVFNVSVTVESPGSGIVKTAGFRELERYLPYNKNGDYVPNSIVVSTTIERSKDKPKVIIDFPLLSPRPRNVKIDCVSWDNISRQWSSAGCEWAGPSEEQRCTCYHLSSFAILMSKYPVDIPFMTEVTCVGLSISILSLIISLVIQMIVWTDVVKTNTLYLRHTAHMNISLCLLVADCVFLASSQPKDLSEIWCKTFAVLKHFCFLSMFFWTLCLSTTLLHQAVFLFHKVSKKNYLRFSLVLGYSCPLLIVFVTFLSNQSGAEGSYFSKETCWLVYTGLMSGSIHTFVIPVGIIIFVNVFSMIVVIMKLLDQHKNTEKSHEQEKTAAKTVMRTVILLTPIFGVTWLVGFAVLLVDLTVGSIALAVNYAFTMLNAFQGLFILLTTCLGDKMTREALLNHLKRHAPGGSSNSTTK